MTAPSRTEVVPRATVRRVKTGTTDRLGMAKIVDATTVDGISPANGLRVARALRVDLDHQGSGIVGRKPATGRRVDLDRKVETGLLDLARRNCHRSKKSRPLITGQIIKKPLPRIWCLKKFPQRKAV